MLSVCFIQPSTYFYHAVRLTTIYHLNLYIYIYIYIYNTETVLSRWLAANEARVSHVFSHVVWWKKGDLALNNQQGLICHKTQSTNHLNCLAILLILEYAHINVHTYIHTTIIRIHSHRDTMVPRCIYIIVPRGRRVYSVTFLLLNWLNLANYSRGQNPSRRIYLLNRFICLKMLERLVYPTIYSWLERKGGYIW